jgi:hypothetical protein
MKIEYRLLKTTEFVFRALLINSLVSLSEKILTNIGLYILKLQKYTCDGRSSIYDSGSKKSADTANKRNTTPPTSVTKILTVFFN